MEKIELIKQAIHQAESKKSNLFGDVLSIGGYTGEKTRHLLNNLGAISQNVLEIGSHRGSTICSTIFKNENIKNVYYIDNFSEFDDGTVKGELLENVSKFGDNTPHNFIEKDCFIVSSVDIPTKIDFYCYDGNHSYEAQKRALTHFKPFLADEFIFVVDDFSWDDVRSGTQDGIFENGMKILFQKQLGVGVESDGGGYWNGVLVALIKK